MHKQMCAWLCIHQTQSNWPVFDRLHHQITLTKNIKQARQEQQPKASSQRHESKIDPCCRNQFTVETHEMSTPICVVYPPKMMTLEMFVEIVGYSQSSRANSHVSVPRNRVGPSNEGFPFVTSSWLGVGGHPHKPGLQCPVSPASCGKPFAKFAKRACLPVPGLPACNLEPGCGSLFDGGFVWFGCIRNGKRRLEACRKDWGQGLALADLASKATTWEWNIQKGLESLSEIPDQDSRSSMHCWKAAKPSDQRTWWLAVCLVIFRSLPIWFLVKCPAFVVLYLSDSSDRPIDSHCPTFLLHSPETGFEIGFLTLLAAPGCWQRNCGAFHLVSHIVATDVYSYMWLMWT